MSTQLQRCLISTEITFDIFIGHAIINIGEIIYLLYDYGLESLKIGHQKLFLSKKSLYWFFFDGHIYISVVAIDQCYTTKKNKRKF